MNHYQVQEHGATRIASALPLRGSNMAGQQCRDRNSCMQSQLWQQSHTAAADMGVASRKINVTISSHICDGCTPPAPDGPPGAPTIEATRLLGKKRLSKCL